MFSLYVYILWALSDSSLFVCLFVFTTTFLLVFQTPTKYLRGILAEAEMPRGRRAFQSASQVRFIAPRCNAEKMTSITFGNRIDSAFMGF